MRPSIELRHVDTDNWRVCAELDVAPEQRDFVSAVARYLCLCHYGNAWQPLAAYAGDEVVGFVMWAVDPGDQSGWIGGLVIDQALTRRLIESEGCRSCALSYSPENTAARTLYASLGFVETGEHEGDELVARLSPAGR